MPRKSFQLVQSHIPLTLPLPQKIWDKKCPSNCIQTVADGSIIHGPHFTQSHTSRLSTTGTHISHGTRQFHLSPDRGDVLTITTATADSTQFIDYGGMKDFSWPERVGVNIGLKDSTWLLEGHDSDSNLEGQDFPITSPARYTVSQRATEQGFNWSLELTSTTFWNQSL